MCPPFAFVCYARITVAFSIMGINIIRGVKKSGRTAQFQVDIIVAVTVERGGITNADAGAVSIALFTFFADFQVIAGGVDVYPQ